MNHSCLRNPRGFSLAELVVVVAILMLLAVAIVAGMRGVRTYERRVGMDQLLGVLERARSHALIHQTSVCVAIADPSDFPGATECRIGSFVLLEPVSDFELPIRVGQTERWLKMPVGMVMMGGGFGEESHPSDADQLSLLLTDETFLDVHAVVFGAHGGLLHPSGEESVVLRFAEGSYHQGSATPIVFKDNAHYQVRIGRVSGRSYSNVP